MPEAIRAIQYGLGPIGCGVARHVAQRAGISLVGGVDVDPVKVGEDLGEVVGLGRQLGIPVVPDLGQALDRSSADVVVHATSSRFSVFMPQILEILGAELHVVSTAEELSFPWLAHPDEAREIDTVAKRVGRTVLGTGINPGFIMDSLPLYLTAICQEVKHVHVTRTINASARRGPFQEKIGAGMTVEQFEARMAAGEMGHVGLEESMGMVFEALGWELVEIASDVEPLVARERMATEHVRVLPGEVRGLRQVACGYSGGGELMRLTFVAAVEMEDEGDVISITGRPNLQVRLQGTNGDLATVAVVANAIPKVLDAAPGLVTMRDLPVVTYW